MAGAVGPFLGGWLISAASWRLVFLINLPVAVAVVLMANRHVPESRAPDDGGPLDVRGAAAITLALVGVTYGLTEGPVLQRPSADPHQPPWQCRGQEFQSPQLHPGTPALP